MKKIMLAATSLVALTAAASAADLSPRVYSKAPPAPIAAITNWSGFYIGGFGGYGWSQNLSASIAGVGGVTGTGSDVNGGFGGGTIGYNWQTPGSQFLFGIEVDAAAADIKYGEPGFELKNNAFGSVTGRIGYAFDNVLLYVKGGYGWANNKITVLGVSDSNFHSGYTVGAGLEYMFVPNWSFKAEYMYADYAKENYFGGLVPPGIDVGASFHTVKAGINYHFNWGGPVVARY